MNIRKIKTTAVMTLTVCTLLNSFPTSAQDTPKKASVLDDLEAGEITFGKAAKPPVPNLSAALDPFGDLLLSLLSVSHDEFQKLQKLISDEASSSSEPKTKATSVQNYQLTNKQINSLAERVKSLVKEKQAQAFHAYRIARSDADFLFAEIPIASGIQGELVCNDDGGPPHEVREDLLSDYRIEPPDVLLIELAENLRPTHAPISAGELLIVQVNQAKRSTEDENLTSQQFDTIDGKYIVDTDGYLNLGPEYGKVEVAGQPLAEIQRLVEVHLKRLLKSPQVVVNLANPNTKQQIAGQHLVRPDGTVGLGIYGGCFVAEMTLLEAKGAIERHLQQHIHNPRVSVDVSKAIPDSGGAGLVAALKFETDRTRNGNRLLAGQFRLMDAPDTPVDVEFTMKPQEGAESPVSQMIAIPAGDRIWLLTIAAKRPRHETPNSMYEVQGRFIEVSDKAMIELRKTLSVDSTSSAAWVISKSDASSLDAFTTAQIKAGRAKVLSRPRLTGISGQSMQIQIGSEVPITVPAGGESTAIEFKPVGIGMEVTLTAVTADSDRLDWKLSNTNRDGDWSFVTRNISGASLLTSGESIVVPLPTRNDGMHMVAVLNPARIVKGQDGPFAQKPVTRDQQFAILTEQFNQLMKSRQYAEAILIGQKATELQPDNPAATIMVEKAKLQDQVAIIEKAKSRERLPTIKASNFEVETLDVESNPTVRCDVGYTVKLKHTSRIKAVLDFDSAILKVEPIQGDASSLAVYSLAEGGTQIRIVDEHDAEYLVNVLSLEFSGLDVYLKKLFPNVDIEVWPIRGSVLLRGNVNSELQKEHICDVAEQFYPSILNQLTIESNSDALPLRTNQHVPTSDDQPGQSVITITADSSSLIVPHKSTKLLSLPKRIHSVGNFNSELIKVEPVSGAANRISINALENGATKLTLTDEDHRQYFVDIIVEDSVHELSLLIRRLYPDLDLSFFAVNGAILVRGAVESEVQCQQILDVVCQFSDYVLNQTHIVAPLALTENKTEEPDESVMIPAGVQEIRSDIKALHSDVRELLQLLKARSTQKNQTNPEADLSDLSFRRVSQSDSANTMDIRTSPSTDRQQFQSFLGTIDDAVPKQRRLILVCDQQGLHGEYLELVRTVCRTTGIGKPALYASGPYFTEKYGVQNTPCLILVGAGNQAEKLEGEASEDEIREMLTVPSKPSIPSPSASGPVDSLE